MGWKLPARAATACAIAAGLAGSMWTIARAATPSGGTLSPSSATLTWDGFPGPAASPEGETTCLDGTTCDVYTFRVAAGDYTGKRVRFRISWQTSVNDYDVYVHQGTVSGPEVGRSGNGAPGTFEENTFDLNQVVVPGVNDTYTVHVVYWTVGPLDPYKGQVSLEAIPPSPTRTATFVKGPKTGIKFSRSRPLYATGAGQDVEPSARVDFKGNAYAGGIRGLTGGNDIWRFDLNPNSPTFDPYLTAAAITFDLDGRAHNPSYKGQPDAINPNDGSELGGDGGGDLDLAVGFKPPAGAAPDSDPLLAASSLVAANVSSQRSSDRAENYDRNPAGNTTVPVDDRQWQEFLGGDAVYLGYREFTGLQATSKYYINRSDDGGLTYGPALVAAVGGNVTGNIDVDQRDGTVYFCHQGDGTDGNKQVRVAVGHPLSLAVPPAVYTTRVAATGAGNIATLFPVCKVASDGTVYVAYSDAGHAIYIAHSTNQGATWSLPVRVSDMSPGSAAMMPWIETGARPGSLAIAWYGADVADNEGNVPGNTTAANWKVYFAETLTATASSPTILQTVASDHFNHGADISTAGFVVGGPNRNLADFFQIAIDPMGFAFIAFTDDSQDFSGHSWATHQVAGPSLNTGRTEKIKMKEPAATVDTSQPEVMDWRHDARLAGNPPTEPDADTPVDVVSIDFGCATGAAGPAITATLGASGLDTMPPEGIWRMNFATNPTKPGLSDRADQWFISAETDASGTPAYWYGTAARNRDGTLTYTKRGPADAGRFDLVNRSVSVRVGIDKLNALQTRGAIVDGTQVMGTRGSASATVSVPGVASASAASDATRGGRSFTVGQGCSIY
ncbi:MAG: hypothetical protein A3H96_27020 [Acidobacteria bacterium RIFCSPLOWO2_02_FULL_67_36]|nr:MAG: hypothetical protein A3H96_27020 [Acidobacteria bacterium RIFCSPLOWO2_02_FULL_67_36]OFW24519.1 MAG: hypothetical protein A3G21_18365 [Acidobacteria bacterium RIFCSPLOWO2_12_FULL_66_21]